MADTKADEARLAELERLIPEALEDPDVEEEEYGGLVAERAAIQARLGSATPTATSSPTPTATSPDPTPAERAARAGRIAGTGKWTPGETRAALEADDQARGDKPPGRI